MIGFLEQEMQSVESTEARWSTGAILTVFFASSMITALFFGLGYSFGRGGARQPLAQMSANAADQAAASATEPPEYPNSSVSFPVAAAIPSSPAIPGGSNVASNNNQEPRVIVKTVSTARSQRTANSQPATAAGSILPAAVPVRANVGRADGSSAAAAGYMVQVGAIGSHKDARRLVTQLRRHGFYAGIYLGKKDKFLHVQLGPFISREKAQVVRHKVMKSGYHALIKSRA